jgi:hypothetical protein
VRTCNQCGKEIPSDYWRNGKNPAPLCSYLCLLIQGEVDEMEEYYRALGSTAPDEEIEYAKQLGKETYQRESERARI